MASNNVVQLEIQSLLDGSGFDEAKEQLKKLGVNIEKTGKDGELSLSKIDKEVKKTGNSFVELAAKVTAAYMAVKQMINAYVQDVQASAKLTLALKNNTDQVSRQGKSVSALTNEYKDFASAQQEATGIGDEVTLSLMGTLTTLGTMPKDLKRVTAAFQDMEAATGMSADSMARVWARLQEAPDEALGALTRVGVKIRKEHLAGMDVEQQRIFVLEKLEKAFGGQAKAMADATGGVAQAKAAFGDFQEVLGNLVVGIIQPFVNLLTPIFSFFNGLPTGIQATIVGVAGLTTAWLALNGTINMTPIGWVLSLGAALGGLIGVFSKTKISLDEAQDSIDKLNATSEKFEAQQRATSKATNALVAQLSKAKQGTEEYTSLVKDLLKENPNLINSNITVASSFNDIAGAVNQAANAIEKGAMADAYKKGLEDLERMGDTAKGMFLEASIDDATLAQLEALLIKREKMRVSLEGIAQKFGFDREAVKSAYQFGGGSFSEVKGYRAFADRRAGGNVENYIAGVYGAYLRQEAMRAQTQVSQTRQFAGTQIATAPIAAGGSDEVKAAVDLWQLRIDLMTDEFEKRKEMLAKQYNADVNMIREKLGEGATAELALNDLSLKYIKERADLEREEEQRLKEERIKAYNEALTIMQRGLSLGTSIIKKDWKSAIGETLSMIPGVGQTLSGVFGTAVDFFGELFGSKSKTAAEKFSDDLTAAIKRVDAAMERADFWGKLYGDESELEIGIRIKGYQDEISKATSKYFFGGKTKEELAALYDDITDKVIDKKSYLFQLSYNDLNHSAAVQAAVKKRIREWFAETYGSAADVMMKNYGVLNEAGEISIKAWTQVRGTIGSLDDTVLEALKSTVTWMRQLTDDQVKHALADDADKLERIQNLQKTGVLTAEEAVAQQLAVLDASIAELKLLGDVQEAKDAILKLEADKIDLIKQLNQESAKGLDIEDEKLRNLLAQREELERNIAAGYVRKGTSGTVSQQAAILRQIIARAKELGLSRDDYFQYEEALANLMEGFAGSSYTGKTGYGYTPGVEDFVGNMPIGSREFQTSMNTARASRSSTSNITTNTQNVTINGQAMLPNQEFVDGLRVLTKRVYGKDIIK